MTIVIKFATTHLFDENASPYYLTKNMSLNKNASTKYVFTLRMFDKIVGSNEPKIMDSRYGTGSNFL